MLNLKYTKIIVAAVTMSLSPLLLAFDGKPNSISSIEITPEKSSVILKMDNGKKVSLKRGDVVPDTDMRVIEVMSDKLILEDVVKGENSIQKQTVLVYKPKTPGGKSEIRRIGNGNNGYTRKALHLPENKHK